MNLVVVPLALAELQEAAAFYSESAGVELGLAFLAEFERVASALLEHPHLGAIFRGARRRALLRRFPYSVIYQIAKDEVRVIAVAHQHRRPAYWGSRE